MEKHALHMSIIGGGIGGLATASCAGYMEYPFQNKEIKSCEEKLLATSLVFR